ncbi:hypothetical protein [Atopomonas hussainii]|uniref:hypothetical protein n=1 Tax=Atopomonas hussainii TaxID=1429083 RepID=UPI000900359B|nr:hypothetical protein [Atopomonas hussainii]
MKRLDLSRETFKRDLGRLSLAFGIPGFAFTTRYLVGRYFGELRPEEHYLRPIGGVLLVVALLLAPFAYQKLLPEIDRVMALALTITQQPLTRVRRVVAHLAYDAAVLGKAIFVTAYPLFVASLLLVGMTYL